MISVFFLSNCPGVFFPFPKDPNQVFFSPFGCRGCSGFFLFSSEGWSNRILHGASLLAMLDYGTNPAGASFPFSVTAP